MSFLKRLEQKWTVMQRRRFWHATHDWHHVDIILHRGQFWAKSTASGSMRWCFRSCWMVLSHVMRGRPSCLLQSAGGEANRIHNVDELKQRLINVWCNLEQSVFDKPPDQWWGRLRVCLRTKGGHFEHIFCPYLLHSVRLDWLLHL